MRRIDTKGSGGGERERERERKIGVERNLILLKVSSQAQVCLTNSYVGIKVGFFRVKGCNELKWG